MEYKQIQELLKAVNKSNISEVSIKNGDFEITIKQGGLTAQPQYVAVPNVLPQPMAQPQPPVQQPLQTAPAESQSAGAPDSTKTNTIAVKSPMIGTFYRSASPEKPPYASVGDEIRPGQVICIVEAMKLFNEIESEVSGRIVKVLVDDATPVEYDQPLFLVEPI